MLRPLDQFLLCNALLKIEVDFLNKSAFEIKVSFLSININFNSVPKVENSSGGK